MKAKLVYLVVSDMLPKNYHDDIFDDISELLEKDNEKIKTTDYFVDTKEEAPKKKEVTKKPSRKVYQRGIQPKEDPFTTFVLGYLDDERK